MVSCNASTWMRILSMSLALRYERPSAPRRGHVVDPSPRRWYDADRPAWSAPIATASYACTVVQQRTSTGYAAPGPAGAVATAVSG